MIRAVFRRVIGLEAELADSCIGTRSGDMTKLVTILALVQGAVEELMASLVAPSALSQLFLPWTNFCLVACLATDPADCGVSTCRRDMAMLVAVIALDQGAVGDNMPRSAPAANQVLGRTLRAVFIHGERHGLAEGCS